MVPEGRLHMRPFQFHLKEHWRFPQSLDTLLPWTETISAHLDWWQNPRNAMKGADLHPKDHSIQLFTDASNEGWGAHLEQTSAKGLWSDTDKRLHIKVLELKAVSLALQRFKDQCQNPTVLVATDNSTVVAYINKQGGTHSAEMWTLLWKIMTWGHCYQITLKARHIPGCLNVMADLLSRSNQVQSTEWSLHPQVFKQICLKWFTPHVDLFATHLNHKVPLYRVSTPRPKCLGHRCSEHKLVRSHCLCLPFDGSPSQGDPKSQAIQFPDHRTSPRLARDALVLGPSAALNRDPTSTSSVKNSSETVPQLCVPQQSTASQPPHLVSRSGQLQEQGFSVEVTERIAAPQRLSTRTIYQSKWALFERWCSEIHAWVANKVSNIGQWEKVALFPSSDFIAKNQLAREGSQSVSPVAISALTTIVDRQFKEDRTLCPVRALRYYLDRIKDLRGSRSLLFISFKKGHTSDIRPATLSSWLKQTILLCYKQADQQALDLVQVKAHDIRAFASSKVYYGGVLVDQIMQACRWKAHNTFANFYLKDLTWSDDKNMYLGPVVAAQQVLDPSPQHAHLWEEKKGGGAHPLQPSLQESMPGFRY